MASGVATSESESQATYRLGDCGGKTVVSTAEASTDTGVGLAIEPVRATDLFWGARCVNSARRVPTGGRGGASSSLQDPNNGSRGSEGLADLCEACQAR